MSDHYYGHQSPIPVQTPNADHQFRSRSDVWQFAGEHISACGSETYPWNPEIVKAIRFIEPDFCPLWVITAYRSPAGGVEKFGRHAIGKDYKYYDPDEKIRPMNVHTATYGVNAGRRPVLITDILQDKKVSLIPDLKVYGFLPFDWTIVAKARRNHWERKHSDEKALDAATIGEKAALDLWDAENAAREKRKNEINEEAFYNWDHDTNRGKKFSGGISHEEWRHHFRPKGI